jgi:prepilin-type N-terminal cleavage/methylation domain-containing protein
MLGGKNRQPLGYTILEVMIVLAISGVMFLIAATFVNGKQGNTAFKTGVNEMAASLQSIIEQVTDGQYGDTTNFCHKLGNGDIQINGGGAHDQGTNQDCVFLGKILHFTSPQNTAAYDIYTIAGSRFANSSNLLASDPTQAHAQNVDYLSVNHDTPQSLELPHGIQINGGATTSYAIGFLQSLGNVDASTNTLTTGAQTISLYYVRSDSTAVQNTGFNPDNIKGNLIAAQSARICLTDGSRYAEIIIGNGATTGSTLNVDVKMDGAGVSGCP